MQCDVFVSYSHLDSQPVIDFVRSASKELRVWLDRDHQAGDRFTDEIPFRVIGAKVVVVFWSKSSVRSPWVRAEARQGLALGKLISLSLDGTMPPAPFDIVHSEQVPVEKIFLDRWSTILKGIKLKVKAAQNHPQIEQNFSAFKMLSSRIRPTIDLAQSARLCALQHERESFGVEANALTSMWNAERRTEGYRTIKESDGSFIYAKTREGFLRWVVDGPALLRRPEYDAHLLYVLGEAKGVAVLRFSPKFRPPDRVVVPVTVRGQIVDFSGHGTVEDFTGPKFEGQIIDMNPSGYGFYWTGDGGFQIGTFDSSDALSEYSVRSPAISVDAQGFSVAS